MPRVLIADKLPDSARTRLEAAGLEVIARPELRDEALASALAELDPSVLVVRSTQVQAAHFAVARALQLVVRAGAGVNTIDLATASTRGIYVCNCPGMNAAAVVELTLGHIVNADRRIADNVRDLRDGQWRKKTYSKHAAGLRGRTLGIVGFGAIGQEVARVARALGMKVLVSDPMADPERAAELGAELAPSLLALAARADVLTVHCALNPATRGLISAEVFAALREGAILVNTSRGPVVDEQALARAVVDKGIRAGLDVFSGEPESDGAWDKELVGLAGVYGTHHIGASTDQSQEAVAAEAVRVVLEWHRTGQPPNCVNLADSTPATHLLVVRHADRVGVLASILDALQRQDINVQGMENIVFQGALAACARIQLDTPPPPELLDGLRGKDTIFDVQLVEL